MEAREILAGFAAAIAGGTLRVVDLSHPLDESTPVLALPPPFANTPPVQAVTLSAFDERGPHWEWRAYTLGEHTGTHFDAPVHWITGREHADGATDTIAPGRFVAPACVVDCKRGAEADPGFLLTEEHLRDFEAEHGSLRGAWVLMRTGWASRAGDAAAFLNMGEAGPRTPGPTPDAVRYMIAQGAVGFGVETVGTDAGQAFAFDPPYPAHTLLHGANLFGLASLANLHLLPPTGALLVTPPLKFRGGTGSPVRALAIVPGEG